ncbi:MULTISPECIES: ABC transporter permease [Brevibacillus]|jgi:peptide/nickel transport system permease protein|uniref:Dipeptide/oligopeptide/nickel ABC transporter permease n=1 Tax=Brevibacillus borstelensis AK1 TaxID=1300222 RepID=M8EEU1_9BACL|nr:ABC transporter permease [Brevibacillus borstelensis]EMT53995.1 dipeptide/oligopeptide/nickel ABC transporter permease [Brevibacillus borstelensis AK1]KKX53839.1 diguanylate cyclase [Brevibacillus borstelensis cifa_chp40]MBE5395024.1 ABC transporter permease [Brevibacillus borstelensis]MCC0563750.1 ABC transporter permease [Brevibacillus borstelensis]MCM3469551.1 ABC transporter permease [Brevibacillus borstelensis]
MKQLLIRRLIQSIPTLIGASILVFLVFTLAPGDFVTQMSADANMTQERLDEIRALHGLDQPLYKQYLTWMGNLLTGNFGESVLHRQPVTSVINTFMWNSFLIAIIVLVLQWIIASIVGIMAALRQYSIYDSAVTLIVFMAMSFPSFFLGLLMLKFFAVDYQIFPLGGMRSTGSTLTGWADFWDVMKHLALPVIVLTLLNIGSLTRYFRTNMLEVIRQDYVRTARAKGLKERVVIFKHALRNALLPLITLFALEIPGLFSGAIITERIFNWPGIGRVVLDGIFQRDYPLLMGFTMLLVVLTIVANILADLMYGVADPRVRNR